ncbi:MAG: zinc-ribbon domain-containing protein [Thiobacillus sp.]|uniref:zinc ribbon domain-containing protein n=1 Tax=Thiobacillus sp. TaxID=924 RepID=UPI0028953527|nr:zinc-ribbon domain-containing protein [Thiobacillus sp.]MDT3705485.1 zinc-ribbon domain-containing protein [Thiobacillus sp.]
MALTKCSECGHQISKSATQCPNCGAKIRRTSLFTKLVAGFFGLVFLAAILGESESYSDKAKKAEQAASEQTRIAALPPEQQAAEKERLAKEALAKQEQHLQSLGLRWNYQDSPDKMGRGTVKLAYVRSLNEVEFDFPYKEPQRATLQLRKHPKYGNDVILDIERGQFLCRLDGCVVSVRFDQGKPLTFSAVEPEDNSTTTIFISNYDRFVKNVRKAQKVSVEAQFFQEGNRVFEFETAGLNW